MRNFAQAIPALLPAFLLLFLAGVTSSIAIAQEENEKVIIEESVIKNSNYGEIKKTVEIEDENGEKMVTITTTEGRKKTVKILTGEDAEKFLEDGFHSSKVIIEHTDLSTDDSNVDLNGDEKIIIINSNCNTKGTSSTQTVWVTDGDIENNLHMENMNVNVTKGEDGETTKVEISYTDENGEQVDKIMVIDEKEITKSIEEVVELLEDLDIQIEMDVSDDLENNQNVKTVIITKKIIIDDEDISERTTGDSPMFEDFTVSPNPSNGNIKIDFTPKNKGKVSISVSDVKGNILFNDSYNGKGKYTKNISIPNNHGIIMVKVEQGNEVEVRKLIVE